MAKQVKQAGVGAPAKETNTSEHPLADNEGIFSVCYSNRPDTNCAGPGKYEGDDAR